MPVVGSAGRLDAGSGHEVFLDAAHLVVGSGLDAEFVVAGQGPQEAALRRRADRLAIADRVTFAAEPAPEDTFWTAIDLYCQPSRGPTIGLTLARAMAAGIPGIAADVPGLRDLVGRGDGGLTVPPADPRPSPGP